MPKKTKWLITGGAGFIGSSLTSSILKPWRTGAMDACQGQVVILDNFSTSGFHEIMASPPFNGANVVGNRETVWLEDRPLAILQGDIRDPEVVQRATQGADVVVHLAANTGVAPSVKAPRIDCDINIVGTLNCLEAARQYGVQRFVFASSGAPAGLCEPPITERIAPRPASPYGASKLAGEAYCSAYSNVFGVPSVALRFSNVYGPGSWHKGSVVATFIRHAIRGEPVVVNGDGSQTRDFIYIADLIRAVRLAVETPDLSGELFQIATGRETSVNELLALLQEKCRKFGLPEIKLQKAERSTADVLRNFADASKAAQHLGWVPEVSLDAGLDDTLAWFLEQRRF